MNKTYQIKTNAIKGEQQVIDVLPATGKAPVKVPAAAGARYELIDPATQAAPDNIRVKRKGSDLQIYFDGDTEPASVIEGFYQVHTDEQPALIGRTEKGAIYEYIPESAASSAVVSHLGETGNTYGMALGGIELTANSGVTVGLLAPAVGVFSPMLLAAGALGAAALAGGGGSGGAGSTTPPAATAKLADVSDTGTKGDDKTSDATPTLIGTAPTGSASTITVNGKTYPLTINADGTHNFTVPDADKLPDGTYTPVIEVTQNGKSTRYNGTPFTIDTKTSVNITNSGTAGTIKAISGTAEAVDTIEVKDASGSLIGTTTADSNGKWSLTPANAVAAGNVTAIAKDAAGNTAADSKTNLINGGKGLGITLDMDANNDGLINLAEKGNATATNVTVSFDNANVSTGDIITLSEGSTNKTVALTENDVAAGKIVTTWNLPAKEGTLLTLKATIKDANSTPNNVSPDATDSATVDVIAPVNADLKLAVAISTDANNNGWVSSDELGTTTSFNSHATFDKSKAKAGDSILFTATNGNTTLDSISYKLTNSDITNGYVDVDFGKPLDGQTQTVIATFMDAAGNPASDKVSDSAILDTTAPSNAGMNLTLKMSTDGNDDGWVNNSEAGTATAFSSRASFDMNKAVEGESIFFSAANGTTTLPTVTHKLTAADITKGYVDVSFTKPAEGQLQTVTAQYMDKAGNLATDTLATDKATLDTTVPTPLFLTIDLDNGLGIYNDDGRINANEKGTANTTGLSVKFDKTQVAAGDIVTFSNGTTTNSVILDQTMVDAGKATSTGWALPGENATLDVSAILKDAAGNSTGLAKDSVLMDTTAMTFAYSGQSVLNGVLGTVFSSIAFEHTTSEKGIYQLHIGEDIFRGDYDGSNAVNKTFLTADKTIKGSFIYLEFWDTAGNYSSSHLPAPHDATDWTIGAKTQFIL